MPSAHTSDTPPAGPDKQLRAPFRLAAKVGGTTARAVNTAVDKIQSFPKKVSSNRHVQDISSAVMRAERSVESSMRPYVDPMMGYVRTVRPFIPPVLILIIFILLPPALLCIATVAFFTAPLWIAFLFLSAIIWVPCLVMLLCLFALLAFIGLIRFCSAPSVQAIWRPMAGAVLNSPVGQFLFYQKKEEEVSE
ncbi:hypothetical protein GUITHDRAFT_152031 [Guillardia theta CCMP2712]|uniref:Uncharacterized protein n=2 Tax=Guillardia theta TaxID=55529 RepID=L1JHG9_GUITC|nr:hypothetical protein GUITHDRAFT_152031 [Guillardia theta CCMP2712]EKX47589.1 hypothetical protein GUITHDRAFT_152031 [Guillardia theta CCMP2712]|eukprot:XP_005834569.1 hypothetical protein GUITHDRAFT_152031 [Guillardia theta CCMP2712]